MIIFCSEPYNSSSVDPDYEREYEAVIELGERVELISFEDLVDLDDPITAVKKIKRYEKKQNAIYRGWMMTPYYYDRLLKALEEKNITLINTVKQYRNCHYLPNSYEVIKNNTPKSIWCSVEDFNNKYDQIREKLDVFSGKPIIVKDYVKSRKHEWNDACYINNTSSDFEVKRVVNNFICRQADNLNEGLVFREFINLEFLKNHSKSGMPLQRNLEYLLKTKSRFVYLNTGMKVIITMKLYQSMNLKN